MHSFTTERLLIRPLLAEDEAFFCQQFTNNKVMRFNGGILSEDQAIKSFHRSLKANEQAKQDGKKSLLTWAIICLKDEKIIGTQTLSFIIRPYNAEIMQQTEPHDLNQTEIGIMLCPTANGKLFPEEAMGALMEYCFTQLNLERINAFYNSNNLATERFVNKLGFIFSSNVHQNNNSTTYQYFLQSQWQHKMIHEIFIPYRAKVLAPVVG